MQGLAALQRRHAWCGFIKEAAVEAQLAEGAKRAQALQLKQPRARGQARSSGPHGRGGINETLKSFRTPELHGQPQARVCRRRRIALPFAQQRARQDFQILIPGCDAEDVSSSAAVAPCEP